MDRRNFLQSALYAAPLFTAGRLFAAPMSGPRLLLVFLRGAYDASNILVPVSSDFYYQSRPTLAVPRPAPASPNAALPLTAEGAQEASRRGVELVTLPTKDAIALLRREQRDTNAILHVTC